MKARYVFEECAEMVVPCVMKEREWKDGGVLYTE
jgi:hypothetical protein